eukprot:COSAG04_NODE_5211_length_1701_cov_1.506242_1_plen_213_part_00
MLDAHVGALLPDLFGAGQLRDQAGVVALPVAGRRIAAVPRGTRLDIASGNAARVEYGRGAGRAERVGAAGLLARDGTAGILARAGRLGVGDGLVRVGPVRLRKRGTPVVVGGVAAVRVPIGAAAILAADRAALRRGAPFRALNLRPEAPPSKRRSRRTSTSGGGWSSKHRRRWQRASAPGRTRSRCRRRRSRRCPRRRPRWRRDRPRLRSQR